MKRQQRPFAVEIKASRLRPSSTGPLPSSSAPPSVDPFPDNRPARDVHEELVQERSEISPKSQALRTAERIFAGLTTSNSEPPSPSLSDVFLVSATKAAGSASPAHAAAAAPHELRAPGAEVHRPRILPDLSQEARRQDASPQAERTRSSRVKRSSPDSYRPRRKRATQEQVTETVAPLSPAPELAALPSSQPNLPLLLAPKIVGSVARAAGDEKHPRRSLSRPLPRGERWKMRRLPRACWADPGRR